MVNISIYFNDHRSGSCVKASGEGWAAATVSLGEVCVEMEAIHEIQKRWRPFPSPAQTEPQQLAATGKKWLRLLQALLGVCLLISFMSSHKIIDRQRYTCCRFFSHRPLRQPDRQLALLWRPWPQSPAASNRSWICWPGMSLKHLTSGLVVLILFKMALNLCLLVIWTSWV